MYMLLSDIEYMHTSDNHSEKLLSQFTLVLKQMKSVNLPVDSRKSLFLFEVFFLTVQILVLGHNCFEY